MYQYGLGGLEQDLVEAGRLYRLSAAQGDARGQNNLGMLYRNGLARLEQDYVEALRLLRLSAFQNEASGQFNLGAMYALGYGATKDLRTAFAWCVDSVQTVDHGLNSYTPAATDRRAHAAQTRRHQRTHTFHFHTRRHR
jgi:hypothetical protein